MNKAPMDNGLRGKGISNSLGGAGKQPNQAVGATPCVALVVNFSFDAAGGQKLHFVRPCSAQTIDCHVVDGQFVDGHAIDGFHSSEGIRRV